MKLATVFKRQINITAPVIKMAYQYQCGEADDFMVRAENEDEVVQLARQHAEMHDDDHHNQEMSEDDIRNNMQEVAA